MTLTSLVMGGRAKDREAVILSKLDTKLRTAIILEGLPDGSSELDTLVSSPNLAIVRIAPGCMCCVGNMIMRVHLNRMLRAKPERLYISVANSEHIEQLRLFLTQTPYDDLISLTDDIVCST
jgi:G3E family GTPase